MRSPQINWTSNWSGAVRQSDTNVLVVRSRSHSISTSSFIAASTRSSHCWSREGTSHSAISWNVANFSHPNSFASNPFLRSLENAPILATKAIEYFSDAIGRPVEAAGLARTDTGDTVAVERSVAKVRSADWVFAGPGSPTFALAQWKGTPVPDAIANKLRSGGVVVFSSAAALTLGRATVPVYEIYKVGVDPSWLDGLNVLAEIGLDVAVIPHYDNAEGGNHDTHFCYLGERRLAMLEPSLPDGCFVLGIGGHTGLVMDLDADTADIVGKGAVTLRRNGESVRIESGQTVPIDTLRSGGTNVLRARTPDHVSSASTPASDLALTPGQSQSSTARGVSTPEVTESLSAAATEGVRDVREVLGTVVEATLAARVVARSEKAFAMSDAIRDQLTAVGIEVRDTPDGAEWLIADA